MNPLDADFYENTLGGMARFLPGVSFYKEAGRLQKKGYDGRLVKRFF